MIIPLATNHGHFALKNVIALADQALKQDLSTEIRDQRTELIVLAKLRYDCTDTEALKLMNNFTKHVHFAFIIPATHVVALDLTSENELDCTLVPVENGNILILSGTLKQWTQLIISLATNSFEEATITVVNELQDYFESLKLSFLFAAYQKKPFATGYILERKKD